MSKPLVAYFSVTGNTKQEAQEIAEATQGDLFEIVPTVAYSMEDIKWNNKQSRSSLENADRSIRPEIAETIEDITEYDPIYVGFPIWWHIYPNIIETFLESYDLSGKTIVPFATSGGSGIEKSVKELKEKLPDSTIKDGKVLNNNPSIEVIKEWIETI